MIYLAGFRNNTILMILADQTPTTYSLWRAARLHGCLFTNGPAYYDRYSGILDWSNTQGRTALHIAALKGNEQLVRVCSSPVLWSPFASLHIDAVWSRSRFWFVWQQGEYTTSLVSLSLLTSLVNCLCLRTRSAARGVICLWVTHSVFNSLDMTKNCADSPTPDRKGLPVRARNNQGFTASDYAYSFVLFLIVSICFLRPFTL